jgi:hypothetical protein
MSLVTPAEDLAEKLSKKGNIKFGYIHLNNLAAADPPLCQHRQCS